MSRDRIKQAIANRIPRRLVLLAGRHNRGRRYVASRYLRGAGIEVGALGQPLLVPKGVRVSYIDRISKTEAIRRFPEVGGAHLVEPTLIGDGFTLDCIAAGSQDFVIANHVLEHAPDPLGVLSSWAQALRPRGVLFVTVPHVDCCFDRGRPVTPLTHLVEDHAAAVKGDAETLWSRSRAHYHEWVTISGVNAAGARNAGPSAADAERRAQRLLETREEIHFHTFTDESYREMLSHFVRVIMPTMQLAEVMRNRTEIIGVLQKGAEPAA